MGRGDGAAVIDFEIDRAGLSILDPRESTDALRRRAAGYSNALLGDERRLAPVVRAAYQLAADGDEEAVALLGRMSADLIESLHTGSYGLGKEGPAPYFLLATRALEHSSLRYVMAHVSDGLGGTKHKKGAPWHLTADWTGKKTLCGRTLTASWKRGNDFRAGKKCALCYEAARKGRDEEIHALLAREGAEQMGKRRAEIEVEGATLRARITELLVESAQRNPTPAKAARAFAEATRAALGQAVAERTVTAFADLQVWARFDRLFQPYNSFKGRELRAIKTVQDALLKENPSVWEKGMDDARLTAALAYAVSQSEARVGDDRFDVELLAHLIAKLVPEAIPGIIRPNGARTGEFQRVWRERYPQLVS